MALSKKPFCPDELLKILKKAQRVLNCPVCLESIINPVQLTNCGHVFCNFCIKKNNDNMYNPCPVCGEVYCRRHIVRAKNEHQNYKNMLERIIVELSADLNYDISSHLPVSSTLASINSKNNKSTVEETVTKDDKLEQKKAQDRRSGRRTITDFLQTAKLVERDKHMSVVDFIKSSTLQKESIKQNETSSDDDLDIFVRKHEKTESLTSNKISKSSPTKTSSSKKRKPKAKENNSRSNEKKNSLYKSYENKLDILDVESITEDGVKSENTFINQGDHCKSVNMKDEINIYSSSLQQTRTDANLTPGTSPEPVKCLASPDFTRANIMHKIVKELEDKINCADENLNKFDCSNRSKETKNSDMNLVEIEKNTDIFNLKSITPKVTQSETLSGSCGKRITINNLNNVNKITELIVLNDNENLTNIESCIQISENTSKDDLIITNQSNLSQQMKKRKYNVKEEIKSLDTNRTDEVAKEALKISGKDKISTPRKSNKKSQNVKKTFGHCDSLLEHNSVDEISETEDVDNTKTVSLATDEITDERILINKEIDSNEKFEKNESICKSNTEAEDDFYESMADKEKLKTTVSNKRKREESNKFSIHSPAQSPVKKRLCHDVGIQTSPSRMMSLLSEMYKLTNNSLLHQAKSSPNLALVSPNFTTPMSTVFKHHSTPFSELNIAPIEHNENDISIQLTQKNPNLKHSCAKEQSQNLNSSNFKTPSTNRILVTDGSEQHYTILSNPTTSEKKKISDSKFFNESIGMPGDSFLENTELSVSLLQDTLQNSNICTEIIENTPPVVNVQPKRTSRRLLEFYDGDDSVDLFETENNKNHMPPLDSETCSESVLVNEPMEVQSTCNSDSSLKENKSPGENKSLRHFEGIQALENDLAEKIAGTQSVVHTVKSPGKSVEKESIDVKVTKEIIEDSDNEEGVVQGTPETEKPNEQLNTHCETMCTDPKKFCFTTSSLRPSQLRNVKLLAEALDCRISSNVTHETTHLIMPVFNDGTVKQTLKYLQALALHKVIVSFDWVTCCLEAKTVLDVNDFFVKDTDGAPSVIRSLSNCHDFLLDRFAISVVEDTGDLTSTEVEELLDACGAIIIKDPRCFNFVPDKLLRMIITEKENCEEEAKAWLMKYNTVAVRVGWLITSIGQYKLAPLSSYLHVPVEADTLVSLGFPLELTVAEEEDQ